MAGFVQVLVLISIFWHNFGQSYVLLSQFHQDHPGKCSLEAEILHPPLPELNITSLEPGEVVGTEYDETKSYCNKLSCSLWKNHKGEGYRLENLGCAVINRPDNCLAYTNQDDRLPWPDCCYFSKCPQRRIRAEPRAEL